MSDYFNFWVDWPTGSWGLAGFLNKWRRIYEHDPRWAPPAWQTLVRLLVKGQDQHLARCRPQFVALEALPRRRPQPSKQHGALEGFSRGLLFETPVAAGVVLVDPRRADATAHLALVHVANSREALERLLYAVEERLAPLGIRRLLLPLGLSPFLGAGVLQSHFHRTPPLHAPYDPPYAAELFSLVCRPVGRSLMFVHTPTGAAPAPPHGPAQIAPLDPQRLSRDLLPLFAGSAPTWAGFPPPDQPEVQFLLTWLGSKRILAWIAELNNTPVGFLVAQPDLGEALRRSQGGRTWPQRLQLAWLARRPANQARLLFFGVREDARRQGVARQLWRQLLAAGPPEGWREITAGPIPTTAGPAMSFLTAMGAASRESYLLYQVEF